MPNNFEETVGKIGLFGGAFDPVHRAHIKMAKMAADQLRLDSVIWIPAGNPVHKEIDTPARHRLCMLEIALKNLKDERMVIDQRELSNGVSKPSYTCQTMKSLMKDFPKKRFFWILGEDQLLNFKSWKNWKWLLRNVVLVLCRRTDENVRKKKSLDYLSETIKSLEQYGGKIMLLNMKSDSVSSSRIRYFIRARQDPLDILDKEVYEYAKKNNLYSY
ncbi:nicotinate (nicotinamide) nucleotide adenylyltransferase [Betaproteobacteria bacterium]|nr:nicotinate (nicotinamide) nucleotide adenylyltransferase [Betaproteobacteria bacterium]